VGNRRLSLEQFLFAAYSIIIRSNAATIVFKQGPTKGGFKLQWSEIAPAEANRTMEAGEEVAPTTSADAGWTCGGELVADYETKVLRPATVNGRYLNNQRCRWRIQRPKFASLNLRVYRYNRCNGINNEMMALLI